MPPTPPLGNSATSSDRPPRSPCCTRSSRPKMVAIANLPAPRDVYIDFTDEQMVSQDSPSTLLLRFDSIRSTLTAVDLPEDVFGPCQLVPKTTDRKAPREHQRAGHVEVSPLRINKKQKTTTMQATSSSRSKRSADKPPRAHPSRKPVPDAFSPATTLGFTFQGLSTKDVVLSAAAYPTAGPSHSAYPRKTSTANSELHLGLGSNITDGGIAPGPSPPVTPTLSPLRRAFVAPRDAPAIPATPSRAGSKALQMLGSADLPRQAFQSGSPDYKAKKRDFFRPLPSGIARELDTFFGAHVKPSKKPAVLRTSKALPAPPASTMDRKVGQGATVVVRDDAGQVWHDLEEQAEFAWLLSEQGKGAVLLSPIHLRGMPSSPLASSPETEGDHLGEHVPASEDAVRIVSSEDSDDEDECDPFGVPGPWQSVFNIQDNKASFSIGSKVSSFLGVAPGEAASKGLAFLSTDPYAAGKTPKPQPVKRRPPPLALGVAARMKPINTIAVQQDFIATSFVGAAAREPEVQAARGRTSRIGKSLGSKASPPQHAPAWESKNSFIDTSRPDSLAVSMSKKVGGIFRGM